MSDSRIFARAVAKWASDGLKARTAKHPRAEDGVKSSKETARVARIRARGNTLVFKRKSKKELEDAGVKEE